MMSRDWCNMRLVAIYCVATLILSPTPALSAPLLESRSRLNTNNPSRLAASSTASSTPRLSLADSAEWTSYDLREPDGPGTYSFGYDVEDADTGNTQFRTEERLADGTVKGSYGYVSPDGGVHVVHYVADRMGYRAKVEDGRRSALMSNKFESRMPPYDNISPEMLAALQSLQNQNKHQIEDQHVRPIDQLYPNGNSRNPSTLNNNNNLYNVYYVPANSIIN